MRGWRRHLFYTKPCVKTTWTLRLAALALITLIVVSTRGSWIAWIGGSLTCPEEVAPSDAILIENFDPSYILFERAAALEQAGLAPRTFVHVAASPVPTVPNPVARGVAEVMARQARLGTWTVIPITLTEPISLNAAMQIRDHLVQARVGSLIVVAPGFRSRRSALVYRTVLGTSGVRVRCVPVFGRIRPERWTETFHGMQEVTLELVKLHYYRLYVLPFAARRAG